MSDHGPNPATRGTPVSLAWFEVADALWLAGRMAAAEPGLAGDSANAPTEGREGLRCVPVSGEAAEPEPRAAEEMVPGPDNDREDSGPPLEYSPEPRVPPGGEELLSRLFRLDAPLDTTDVPLEGVRPIPDRRPLERALRPFKQTRNSRRGDLVLDEDATAHQAVQDGLWLPCCRPATERWLDLDVVVDDSWLAPFSRPIVAEFLECLAAVGAFRMVTTCYLAAGKSPDRLVLRRGGPPSPGLPAERFIGWAPADRRLVMVLTDGTGDIWHSGEAQRLVGSWARRLPVVLINLLSRRQWRRTGIETFPAGLATTAAPVLANARYRVSRAASFPGDVRRTLPDGVPVPMIELEPAQLTDWAKFATAAEPTWFGAVAMCGAETAPESEASSPPDVVPDDSPFDLVRRFRAAVSPTVYSLAVHLAAVPLNVPVMRLVQRTMLPGSRPSDLMELVGSGLLQELRPAPAPGAEAPGEVIYDFRPGVRGELLSGGLRSETTHVVLTVARHLGERVEVLRHLADLVAFPHQAEPTSFPPEIRSIAEPIFRALAGPYLRLLHEVDELEGKQATTLGHPEDSNHYSPSENNNRLADHLRRGGEGSIKDSMRTLGNEAIDESVETETVVGSSSIAGVSVQLRSIPQDESRDPADPPPVWGNIPPQNITFTGRESLLEQLHERLSLGTTAVLPQALHGMGGVGKSQIAIEYVYRHVGDYDLIWWVRAERTGQIQQDLAELAGALGLPVSDEVNVAVPAVREALRLGRPFRNWLLIFDNAEELESVREFFPTSGPGKILVTSRNQAWTKVAKSLEVDIFARDESMELLRRRGPELDDSEADELAEVLGDLPLAIEQAAVWLAETGMPVDEYLTLFMEKHELAAELLRDSAPVAYELPVAAAWNVSLDRLRTNDLGALQLLRVCAFFAPEPISLRLLSGTRNIEGPPELLETLADPIRLRRAIRSINQYALAKISHKHNTIMLHRLVQRVLVGQLNHEEMDQLRRCAHQLLAKSDPDSPDRQIYWQHYADILPHILYSDLVESDDVWARQLLLNEIDFLFQWGDHAGFLDLSSEAVRVWTEKLGEDHEQTMAAALHLGRALRLHGRFDEAFQCHAKVRDFQLATHGADDERTLEAQRFVAADLRYLGKFKDALEIDQRSLDVFRRRFGDDDPLTLRQAHSLGVGLRLTGRAPDARTVDRENYQRLVSTYGELHSATIASLAAIAVDEMECGDFQEGRKMMRINLQQIEAAFGNSFAGLAEGLSALSVMERKAGDHEEALKLSSDALPRYETRYGRVHPGSISAALNHAVNLRHTGRIGEAIKLSREAADRFAEMFGPEHPNTSAAYTNLAVALRSNGQTEEARALNEMALESLSRVLGQDHPRSVVCAVNLASDHYALGHFQAALDMDEKTLALARRRLGDDHPITLACQFNHALDLYSVGNDPANGSLVDSAVEAMRAVLGPVHPATVSARQGTRADCDIYPIPV